MTIRLICLDADDTLWHNMRHFALAEDTLAGLLQPLAAEGVVREAMNAREVHNLPLYGYGAKGFTLSMIETALDLCGDDLRPATVRAILDAGRTLLAHPVQLLPGVADTLPLLAERARLVLVTKGDLLHQETKLAASGLGDRFAGVEIVSAKTTDTYRRVFARYDTAPAEAIMVGDSMRSDVLPALDAGAHAAFIAQPGAWTHEHAAAPDDHPRFHRLSSLSALPALLDELDAAPD